MLKITSYFDSLLNSITMYRLVLYGLGVMALTGVILGTFNVISYSGINLILSLLTLLVSCFAVNYIFSKIFRIPTSHESSLITALILFFVMLPAGNNQEFMLLALSGVIAIASKYLLAIHRKHIFNPAALSALFFTLSGLWFAVWWVGSLYMLPVTLVVGLLIVRKIRKFKLFFTFTAVSLFTMLIFGIINHRNLIEVLTVAFTSYPLIFFGTIMLTEPSTTPPTRRYQLIYATIVGILFGSQFHIGPFTSSPEISLVIGNVFSYIVSYKARLVLVFKEKRELAQDTFEFVFSGKNKFSFIPGQYLEWTLPGVKLDSRGNRRYFTIASSPTEEDVKLGIKFNPNPSSFKKTLSDLKVGDKIFAGQLSGDFTLPENKAKKLVFIAGGIGITPFRSILEYLMDKNEERSIVLFYQNKTPQEIAYKELLTRAEQKLGAKVVNVISEKSPIWTGETGHINEEMIKKYVPDYKERIFYISGPNGMCNAYKMMLNKLSVPMSSIVTDYFPGF